MNYFGRNHETLYIAISMFDRFLARNYLHTNKQKETLAVACAFVAIKFNEEFDPEIESTIKTTPVLKTLTQSDIIVFLLLSLCCDCWII